MSTPLPRTAVTDTILALLVAAGATLTPDVPVGEPDDPPPATAPRWVILEQVASPGETDEITSMDDPEGATMLRFRVRTGATDPTAPRSRGMTRKVVQDVADLMKAALLNRQVPISGDGWRIGGRRCEASSGVDFEGPTANVVDDYVFMVTRGPAAP